MKRTRPLHGITFLVIATCLTHAPGINAQPADVPPGLADRVAKIALEQDPNLTYLPGRVLVRFTADAPAGLKESALGALGTLSHRPFKLVPGLERLDIAMEVPQAVAYLQGSAVRGVRRAGLCRAGRAGS